ncbi:flagellar filament capping protein FliD [Jannaschia sp. R86511]|uniref:flagellar filament capping protein FliD n=1 Tax=Jannaschia sp. R86511 TaxID=3093853 RepID=UPI0036D2C3FB
MGTFGIDGLASGLDTTTLINQLMQVEAIPQQQLKTTLRNQTSSVTAFQVVASRLKSAETAIAALTKDATWDAKTSTVTGTSLTATSGTSALAGKATIDVLSLATAARTRSTESHRLDATVTDGGPLTILNAKGVEVTVTPRSGSLADVIAAINDTPDTGLTAVAVRTGADTYTLQLQAKETGAGTPAAVTSGLTIAMDPTVAGVDAVYEVDGIRGTSASNTVADILPGVTVNLTGTGPSTVTVASDQAKTTAAVKAVVDAVNAALDEIATQTKNDPAATTRAPLSADTMVRSIGNDLLRAASDALGGRSAAEVGIQTTRTGRLVFDEAAFADAYARDPQATRAFIAPAATTVDGVSTPRDGLATRLTAVLERATNAESGTITSAVQGREQRSKDLQTAIDSWDRRLEVRRTILQRQFTGLEVALGKLQSQSSWLSGQLAGLQANLGNGS